MIDKQQQGKSNKLKGRRFEAEVVGTLKSLGHRAVRTGTAGMPTNIGDIAGLGIHVEVKNLENLAKSVSAGFKQAREAGEAALIIAARRGEGPEKAAVCFPLDTFNEVLAWAAEYGRYCEQRDNQKRT